MKRYAVIGSPVAHSLSPAMQQAAFAAAGIAAAFDAIEMTNATLATGIEQLRTSHAGWNVTTPLKAPIVPFLDALSVEARAIGAVNVVRREDDGRLTGHNTDGDGLVRALVELWGWRASDNGVLLLGSGPAARAIAYALREAGAARISCWSRNRETAALIGPPPDHLVSLLISALPASATIGPDVARYFKAGGDVFDVNYNVDRSPLAMLPARRKSDGLPLLLHQGALAFEWWTGHPPSLEAMRSALCQRR